MGTLILTVIEVSCRWSISYCLMLFDGLALELAEYY